MIIFHDKKDCCGCSACEQICHVKAITMRPDDEGFLYPEVDQTVCVNCHLCVKICPIINNSISTKEAKEVFICQNNNTEIRKLSTSGGVFSALAEYVLERNGYVFGATFDSEFNVIHSVARNEEEISSFRGSKYSQSNMKNCFSQIKKLLMEDSWILFTGTPCQTKGLANYLNKSFDKLIIMDLACYGVGSPVAFKNYLKFILDKKNISIEEISNVKFRDKSRFGYEYSTFSIYDKNNRRVFSSGAESCGFLRSFVANDISRPACYDCKFKKINRISDFTVWDCYNVYEYDKRLDDNIGTSHVMIHTFKGKQIFNVISKKLNFKKVNSNDAVKSEPSLTISAEPGKYRDVFFKDLKVLDGSIWDKYYSDTLKVKTERFLRINLSKIGLYKHLKRFIKGKSNGKK